MVAFQSENRLNLEYRRRSGSKLNRGAVTEATVTTVKVRGPSRELLESNL